MRQIRSGRLATRGLAVVAMAAAGLGAATTAPASAQLGAGRQPAPSVSEPALQQRFGSLSGTVVSSSGQPAAGTCVTASPLRSQQESSAGSLRLTTTSAAGRYFFTGLPAGTYRLGFKNCPTPGEPTHPTLGVTIGEQTPTRLEPVVAGVLRPVARVSLPTGPVVVGPDGRQSLSSLFGRNVTLTTPLVTRTTGSISGSVTSVNGTPLSGICAVAITPQGRGYRSPTSATGSYEIKGLRSGGYYVLFTPACGNHRDWIGTSYANRSLVAVNAGQTVASIDGNLQQGSSISGTVTNQKGVALSRVCVTAISVTASSLSIYEEIGLGHGGTYVFSSLPPGPYTVVFLGCGQDLAPQWWNDQSQFQKAKVIHIAAGKSATGIDAALARGGTITGRVTNASGMALAGICADVTVQVQKDVTETNFYGSGPNGMYSIPSLGTGTYIPQFMAGCPSEANYAPTTDPTKVTVVAGMTTTGANVTMIPGATISGKVTGPAGHGLGGICVAVGSTNPLALILPVATRSNGNYSVKQLPAGGYELEFTPGCPNKGNYVTQFYDNQISPVDAALITLTTGGTAPGIDAALLVGGTMSGTVTDAGSHPVAGACVEAFSVEGLVFAAVQADIAGEYKIEGLPTDSYFVFIDPTCGGGQSSSSAAIQLPTEVSVTAGQSTADIDASLPEGGAIAGKVKPAAIFGCLYILGPGGGLREETSLLLSPNGSYDVQGVLPGSYVIAFSSCGIGGKVAPEFYPDSSSLRGAKPITVTAGSTTSRIDFSLPKTAEITGHVSRPGGGPALACIFAVDQSPSGGVDDKVAISNRKGNYVLSGIGTGTYVLKFGVCGEPPGAAPVKSAPVSVADGMTVSGIDATLAVAGFVTGKVTSTTGEPLAGVCVIAGVLDFTDETSTLADGTYELAGLPAGNVTIFFAPDCGIYGTWSSARATAVRVLSHEITPGVDARLAPGGSITGTVTDSGGGANEVCVIAVGTRAGEPSEMATSGSDGSYSIAGLPRGRYDVEFTNGCGNPTNYVTQWWEEAGSQADATVVAVPSGSVETGIDAELTVAP